MSDEEFGIQLLSRKERMYRLAKSMICDGAEADDVVQDVFERLWMRRELLAGQVNLDAFILTSVRNSCLDRIRRTKTRQDKGAQIAAFAPNSADERGAVEMRDMQRIAQRIISGLPERQRFVIHLRDVEGCETAEIARLADMDEATVRMNLSRARKAVREKMLKIMNYGL